MGVGWGHQSCPTSVLTLLYLILFLLLVAWWVGEELESLGGGRLSGGGTLVISESSFVLE